MKIKSLEMQKKFACLYPLGTLMDVTVLSFSWQNHIWVKSTGGCRGILCEQFNFPQGTEISAVVTGIRDGIPVFSPTPEWCLAHAPKKARVLFITPIGVALKTEDDLFVLYAPKVNCTPEVGLERSPP